MIPKRLSAKIFANRPEQIDLANVVPVFQRWIQEKKLEGMLIDVADYKHVHNGPGVLLVAHEGDYGFDIARGRAGLKYTQKRDWPASAGADTLNDALRHVTRLALDAAVKLGDESSLGGLGFDGAEIELTFIDRLNYPNTPDALEQAVNAVRTFAASLYGEAEISVAPATDDPREPLTITLTVSAAPDVADLRNRLAIKTPA